MTELEQAKEDFHGGSLQTVYYWKGMDKAIEVIKDISKAIEAVNIIFLKI